MGWIEPKTDWDPTKDRLNPESYNRIRNNLAVLGELVNEIYAPLTLESMGEEKNYSSWYYAREFNVFERNLDAINQTSYNKVIGTTKTLPLSPTSRVMCRELPQKTAETIWT